MEWISFFDRQPENGQGIWYYGPYIGVWAGEYVYSPNDPYSPHIMLCHEAPGFVDRMDAPWWMPNDGTTKRPAIPENAYPKDYPKGVDKTIKDGRIKQKENKMQKIIVEIEASEWTQENIDSFHDWLQDEMHMGNMGTGDDASVVSVKFAETK